MANQDVPEFNENLLLSNHMIERNNDQQLLLGARFNDVACFRHALRCEAIVNSFEIKFKANDKKRVIAVCSYPACSWRIRASLCEDEHSFEVRRLEGKHTCPGVNRAGNKVATTGWVAHEIQDMVKKNPEIAPKQISNSLECTFGLSLSYKKLWRSRENAKEIIFGSVDDSYQYIPALAAELRKRNPGSHITYTFDGSSNSFKRLFVSFKVCSEGFLAGCRYLIGLDACHLKSKYLGMLLSANTLDGNNGLYNLAFAVVETESRGTWEWFLENLAVTLGSCTEALSLSFISDMEKGLGEAIKIVFPCAEHRVCLRHLWKNLKKFFKCQDGPKIRALVWSAANEPRTHEFRLKLSEIHDSSPQVHAYLLSLSHKWSKSQFEADIRNDSNTNNLSKSFNAWIAPARTKPAVDLVDTVRAMIMESRAKRKITALGWTGLLVPHVQDHIRDISTRKDQFMIRQSTVSKYEVCGRRDRAEVDLEANNCSCRAWQLTGLPCEHAGAVIGMVGNVVWEEFVHEAYHVRRYLMAYDGAIATMPAKEQWECAAPCEISVPNTSRPRGRPRKNRIKSFTELAKKTHKCSRCGLSGHHRSTCKNPLKQGCPSQGSSRSKLPCRRESIEDDTANYSEFIYDDSFYDLAQ